MMGYVKVLICKCVKVINTISKHAHINTSASLLLFILLLTSCGQNSNQRPNFGTIDSAAIAADTAMQLGIESSYEYHKTLAATDTVAYDIIGYGGSASKGELAILRRGATNKADTVFKQPREGIITDVVLKNGELRIALQHPKDTADKKIIIYHIAAGK
jgi:hypothetical protein